MTKVWGPSVWLLFHTLVEKIKPEYFESEKGILIKFIRDTCRNLPCPTCSIDATNILQNLNEKFIVNKEDLINFVHSFHNRVNQKLRKPQYSVDELNKYKNANTINIIKNFFNNMNKKSGSFKMMSMNFHKTQVLSNYHVYLTKNLYKFEL